MSVRPSRRVPLPLEPLLLAAAAISLLLLATWWGHPEARPPAVTPGGALAKRREVIALLGLVYGILLAGVAAWSGRQHLVGGQTLRLMGLSQLRACAREVAGFLRWLWKAGGGPSSMVWLGLIMGIAAVLGSFFLSQPMRYDEAYTYLHFIATNLASLFNYPVPNNHVFHTILVKISVSLLGDQPFAIRLPAFLAGLLVIPLSYFLARLMQVGGSMAGRGYITAALVAVSPCLLVYNTMARGYSLMVMFSLLLILMGWRFRHHATTGLLYLMAIVSALGLWTMPTFLFVIAGVWIWLGLPLPGASRPSPGRIAAGAAVYGGVTGGLTLLMYTPVIIASNGTETITNNPFVRSLPLSTVLVRLPDHLTATLRWFTNGLPPWLVIPLSLLVLFGLMVFVVRRRWIAATLLPSLLVGGTALIVLKRVIPFERSWIYLVPLLMIHVEVAFLSLPALARRASHQLGAASAAAAVLASTALMAMGHSHLPGYRGAFPEAPFVAEFLSQQMGPDDGLVMRVPVDEPVLYYLHLARQSMAQTPSGQSPPQGQAGRPPQEFLVIKPSRYSAHDLSNERRKPLLILADAQVWMTTRSDDAPVAGPMSHSQDN